MMHINFPFSPLAQPIDQKQIARILLILVLALSLLTGYYHLQYTAEQKKYLRLEDRYVRVRDQIGRDYMQQLIDASYE